MKFSKEQTRLSEFFFEVITEHTDSLVVIPAQNKETGIKTVVICMAKEDEDGEETLFPIASLFTEKDNPYEMFEMSLAQNMQIIPEETPSVWWKFWS